MQYNLKMEPMSFAKRILVRERRVMILACLLGKTIGATVPGHILGEVPKDLQNIDEELLFMIMLSKSGSVALGTTRF